MIINKRKIYGMLICLLQVSGAGIRGKTAQHTRIHYRDKLVEVDLTPGQTIRLDNQLHILK
jgi:hypothetical protein